MRGYSAAGQLLSGPGAGTGKRLQIEHAPHLSPQAKLS